MSVAYRVQSISKNDNLNINTEITTAKIELTGKCTLSCQFCANKNFAEHNVRQTIMTEEHFEKVIKAINNVKTLKEVGLFFMGESGLHPLLSVFYKKLSEAGYFTYLTTNGTIIYNILKAIPYIDSLKVSWNYKNKEDFMAKTNKSSLLYDNIITNINILYEECHRYNKKLAISTVLDSKKEDYESSLSQLKYDEHYYLPLQSQCGIITGENGVIGTYDNPVSPLPCWSLFKGLYVDVDLNVRTCCYSHSPEHILGNILEEDINVILNRKNILKKLQLEKVVPKICTQCQKHD